MCLGAQKYRLIQTFFLSTYNICFGKEIRKIIFSCAFLTEVLSISGGIFDTKQLHSCVLLVYGEAANSGHFPVFLG